MDDETCQEMNDFMESLDRGESYESFLKASGWPASLVKAAGDEFTYALSLKDGTVIVFDSAKPSADRVWAHLTHPRVMQASKPVLGDWRANNAESPDPCAITFDRGIDVRVSEIVWACDAPWGS